MAEETPAVPEVTPSPTIDSISDKIFNKMSEETPKPADKPAEETPKPLPADKVTGDNGNGKGELDEKTLADLREGKVIPKHRLDEVLQRMKAYESFGSPEEVRQLKEKFELSLKKPPEPAPTPAELSEEDKQVQEYLLSKIAPELRDLPSIMKMVKEMAEERRAEKEAVQKEREAIMEEERTELAKHNEKASEMIKGFAKEAGLDVEDKVNLTVVLNSIADLVHADPNLMKKYYADKNLDILKDVFDDYVKRFFSGVQRKTQAEILLDKKNQTKLPKAPVKTGVPPKEGPEDVSKLTLDQVGERAYQRIMSS